MNRQKVISQIIMGGIAGFLLGALVIIPFVLPPYLQGSLSITMLTTATSSATRASGPAPSPDRPIVTAIAIPTVTPLPTIEPTPTLQPTPTAEITEPTRIYIERLNLDAPVIPIDWQVTVVNGLEQAVWNVPDWRAAGWHNTSVPLGMPGNTVLNGHNTSRGEVFRDLYKLEAGDIIQMQGANEKTYNYEIEDIYILPEGGQSLETRMQNAQYVQPTTDERLTLVTCHPYGSLANRLIVIAYPIPTINIPEEESLQ
ncbi:MAG: sortase [Anaerolineae bacterium]|nr:sortase [Anaerolineae bacterium]